MRRSFGCALLSAATLCVGPAAAEIDLAARYRATLDYNETVIGREWTATEGDVWRLSGFKLEHATDLILTLDKATVVFGRQDTNVLWAAVFPDQPGKIAGQEAGDGDLIASLWLRFHPGDVGALFPAGTVIEQGPAERLRDGRRLAAWKMNGSWQSGNLPVVPKRGTIVVDIDTPHPLRRFYMIESPVKPVSYVSAFEQRPLPRDIAADRETSRRAFREVWEAFDREYAMFGIKPKVDWNTLRERYEPLAERARTCYELAAVLAEMLAHLEDLHVWVRCGNEWPPGFSRPRVLNASYAAIQATFSNLQQPQRELAWARSADNIGYIAVFGLGDAGLPDAFDAALEQLADTWGLVIDLRFNGGGDELLARRMAGRFLDRARVYSLNQYRSGPKHDELGGKIERVCEPCGPWRYQSPLVVLQGQRTMSSAESFALMLAQCPQATTMGDRTAGSSGNPRILQPGCTLSVALPRWLDMDPAGNPIETAGIAPAVRIEAGAEAFGPREDPVLSAALQRLRATPAAERSPGKR